MARSDRPQYLSLSPDLDSRLKRALKISLIIHAMFLFTIVTKETFFPTTPILYIPSLRVDLVALPDQLKKDINKPRPLPGDDKPITQKKSKATEVADPGEMATKSAPSQVRKKKIQGALARIKALEKIQEEEPKNKKMKGNFLSKGTSQSGDAKESAMTNYYEEVVDQVRRFWELPVWLARRGLSAQVRVALDQKGRILQLVFVKSSGDPQFDDYAKGSIMSAQPFPMPPAEVRSVVMGSGFVLGFPL
ncbi:MAG: cell envelope integrity protein TolA [Xanthomonadaceae bacterium]|nr:cell envelope integrity protein TolA [Xanthomonadaceae bacterium]